MSFFSSLSASISAGIKALGAELTKFAALIKPVIVAEAHEVGQLALEAVMAQAPLVIGGQEKLGAAITSVQGTLAKTGKTAGLAIIQAAVQEAHDLLAQAIHPSDPPAP